jgi:hypothetical protein
MALTRKFLAALGIEESKIESIIDAHTETVDALKGERDRYKADAEKLPEVQKALDTAKAAAKDSGEYDKLKKEFDDYKAEVANKETLAKKSSILKEIAKDAGLSEAGIAKVLKYHDMSKLELDDKGEVKDKAQLLKDLKAEWPEYVQTSGKKGVDTPTPPSGGGGKDPEKYSDIRSMTARWHAAKHGEAPKPGADNGAENN